MASSEPKQDDPHPRVATRKTRYTSCVLEVGERTHTAVVLNLSMRGLFVRTNVSPDPGTPVRVVVKRPGGEAWEIESEVARSTEPLAGMPLISGRGLGLAIRKAPPAYYEFLEDLSS